MLAEQYGNTVLLILLQNYKVYSHEITLCQIRIKGKIKQNTDVIALARLKTREK